VTLTNFPHNSQLDLDPWVGQRSASFRFDRFNAVTGEVLGELHPVRTATLSHNTQSTIKRTLNIALGVEETAIVNTIQERIDLFMVFADGTEYPLGRYMYTDANRQRYTSGKLSTLTLNDEMFLVDQPITSALDGTGKTCEQTIDFALLGLPIDFRVASSPYTNNSAWTVGASRGSILESLSVTGDYFSPWFGNDTLLHFIRSFDPAIQVPDFDFDGSNKVLRASIVESDNLLTAPNQFIVIFNNPDDPGTEASGIYNVPNTSPNSILNRGFVIADVRTLQGSNASSAAAVARNLGLRKTIFETVTLTTVPDPRHDSYNVIKWDGALWLELAWSMVLTEGGSMSHTMRKSYSA
jgi:hypothetical protein